MRNADERDEAVEPLNAKPSEKPAVIISVPSQQKFQEDAEENPAPPDGGLRAWLVCAASFYLNGTIFGYLNSAGVLYVKLKDTYAGDDENSFRVSIVGSLAMGMTFLLSPIASILTDRLGIRKTAFIGTVLVLLGIILNSFVESLELLYLTNGIILGCGASLAYTPSLVILGHYFKRHLGLVNGIVTAGSGVFTIVTPILLKLSLKEQGLATTYQIIAAIMSPLIVCALLFKPVSSVQQDNKKTACRQKSDNSCTVMCAQLINMSIWKNRKYLVWAFAFPISLFGYLVPYTHLVKHVTDILPGYDGELLITCIGASSAVGRILFGKIADFPRVSRIFLQQLSFFFLGVLTMLLASSNTYGILIAICLGLGLFDGCFISLLGPVAFDIIGVKGASQAIGFLLGICAIPISLGAPIAGFMYDEMGKDYRIAFIVAGIPPIVGSLLMFIIGCVKQPTANDECNKHDLFIIKPSATEDTVVAPDEANEEDQNVWKLRPEFQGKQENGFSPQISQDIGLYKGDEYSTLVPTTNESDIIIDQIANGSLTERQSTC